jgi:flagellar motility protein MotE (MotC chaperone)
MVKLAKRRIHLPRRCLAARNRSAHAFAMLLLLAGLTLPLATPLAQETSETVPDEALRYCTAIKDAAREARAAWQAQALLEIEARIEAQLDELARKRVEYEAWLERREAFLRRAEEGVIDIYARMRPDAAAAQLAAMDNETASAVIAKLNPRQASAILNEMEPGRAALLTRTVAGSALKQENAL